MKTPFSLLFVIALLGALVNNTLAATTGGLVYSPAPGPRAPFIGDYLRKGVEYERFQSTSSLGNRTVDPSAFTIAPSLKWSDLALSTNVNFTLWDGKANPTGAFSGLDGNRGCFWLKLTDSATKRHPREFNFDIRSSSGSLRFAGNLATNTATGTELSWSPTTLWGGDYVGGTTNAHTSGTLTVANEIIVPLRVFFPCGDPSSLGVIEDHVDDDFALICEIRDASSGVLVASLVVLVAPPAPPVLVMSELNEIPRVSLTAAPGSRYNVFRSNDIKTPLSSWPAYAGLVENGWSQNLTEPGLFFFQARLVAQAARSSHLLPSLFGELSQTD